MEAKGVVIRTSTYSVKETVDRLQVFLQQHGATVYARINQQAEVNNTGQNLSPLEFILFGNPKSGGYLMLENPLVALDLPLKIISWQDGQGTVWVAYNSAEYIEERFSLKHESKSVLVLDGLIELALNAHNGDE
jgi:uncharacterized protein (DUF302 family)